MKTEIKQQSNDKKHANSLFIFLKYLDNVIYVVSAAKKYGCSLMDALGNNVQYVHRTSCSLASSLLDDVSHRNAFVQQTQLSTQY